MLNGTVNWLLVAGYLYPTTYYVTVKISLDINDGEEIIL
jgi:hypothetical protein